jgi:hypothetical protein
MVVASNLLEYTVYTTLCSMAVHLFSAGALILRQISSVFVL